MPWVQETLKKEVPETCNVVLRTKDNAVARGCSILAQHRDAIKIHAILPRAIGIAAWHEVGSPSKKNKTGRGRNREDTTFHAVILKRHCSLPISIDRQFFTQQDNEREIEITLLEGNNEAVDANIKVGTWIYKHPHPLAKGTAFTISVQAKETHNDSFVVEVSFPGDTSTSADGRGPAQDRPVTGKRMRRVRKMPDAHRDYLAQVTAERMQYKPGSDFIITVTEPLSSISE